MLSARKKDAGHGNGTRGLADSIRSKLYPTQFNQTTLKS